MTNEAFETIEQPPTVRSRRSSLKPPDVDLPTVKEPQVFEREQSSLKHQLSSYNLGAAMRGRQPSHSPTKRLKRLSSHTGRFTKDILLRIFRYLPLPDLMKLRAVSHSWQHVLQNSPELVVILDLTPYNKRITDNALGSIARFANGRPKAVDMSNCVHISDTGFLELVRAVSSDLRIWKMK